MEPIDFKEIAELLSNTNNVDITSEPIKSSKSNWDLYSGYYKVHGEKLPFEVLYLHSKITVDELNKAAVSAFKKGHTRVVFPSSLDSRIKAHRVILKDAKDLLTTKDYLGTLLSEELKTYSDKLIARKPDYYIDPKVEVPLGVSKKSPNPVINALTDIRDKGELIVLLAQPGQGKTFMSEHIVYTIAIGKKNFFPIYINAEQWGTMGPAELGSLWKTIVHSFRHLESPIGWLAGREEEFIQTTLKAGLFCIIFDGFDEYILQNHGKVNAIETIELLSKLVEETSARVLVTSRSTFWEAEVDAQMNDNNRINFTTYRISPFDSPLARKYFASRITDQRSVNFASELYTKLYKKGDEFIGRGFTLSLIADLYSTSNVSVEYEDNQSPFMWLMKALCSRETRRQNLSINDSEQIKLLSLFAAEILQGEEANQILFDYCLESIAPKLSVEARKTCMTNMAPHPLINKTINSEEWIFTQKQARVTLIANYLLEASDSEILAFSEKAKVDNEFVSDIGIALVHMLKGLDKSLDKTKELIERFLNSSGKLGVAVEPFDCLKRLAVTVAFRMVESEKLQEKLERSVFLQSLFPNNEFKDLPFFGGVAKFNFSGVTFTGCQFDHVRWGNCKFDSKTTFDNCTFIGTGSANYCENFGLAKWKSLTCDNESKVFIDSLLISDGTKKYDVNDLKSDIDSILKKFFVAGGLGFKRININNIKTGHISSSRYKDQVLDVLCENVIKLVDMGKTEKNYYEVSPKSQEPLRFFATNNVYTGDIKEAFNTLTRNLCS